MNKAEVGHKVKIERLKIQGTTRRTEFMITGQD